MEVSIIQQCGIYLINICENDFEVTLCNLGASIYGVKFNNEEMVLRTKNLSDFLLKDLYFGKTIGRTCGRMSIHEFSVKGYKYHLQDNDHGASLHGGNDAISAKAFSFDIKRSNQNVIVTFNALSPHNEAGYPGNLNLSVIYEISYGKIKISFRASIDAACLLALTNHTYFCLGEDDKDKLSMKFDADKCSRLDEKLFPLELVDIPDKWKLNALTSLSKTGDIDNFFLLNDKNIVLESDKYRLTIDTDFQGAQIYTDNFPNDIAVTSSNQNVHRSVAIEPEDNPVEKIILNKGEKYDRTIIYRFEKKEKASILNNYKKRFHKEPTHYLESGGRFEMLGNHTDHNHGKTLASTCSLMIRSAFSKEENNKVRFISKDIAEFEMDLSDTTFKPDEQNSPKCFIRGIADYYKKNNLAFGGFSIYMESTIPSGSGVSSSAAFEVLIGKVFNELYNDGNATILDICKAGQYAENNYFGKNSGLLDQIACASMGISYIDFVNIEKPEITILHENFNGYQFVIVDTGKGHAELSDLYSSIPNDMLNAAHKMGHHYLRESSLEELERKKNLLTESEYRRALHFFNENNRVEKGLNFLKNGDFAGYFACVRESEKSSRELLQNAMVNNVYEGSLAEAIDISNKAMDYQGASKINGGGYGGTIIAIVPLDKINKYLQIMKKRYGDNHVFVVSTLNEEK